MKKEWKFQKKPTPYGGIKFGALIIGAAIGLTFGSIADNWGLFVEDETGYFVGVMLFAGIGLILSSLYIKKKLKKRKVNKFSFPSHTTSIFALKKVPLLK